MISKREKQKLKVALGNYYSAYLHKFLKDHNITNKDGTPYSKSMIRLVFNGFRENIEIEQAFFKAAEEIAQARHIAFVATKKEREYLLEKMRQKKSSSSRYCL